MTDQPYGAALARLHHDHFGHVARAAADELLHRLYERGVREGLVVELAVGSGLSSRRLVDAGFEVLGFDISEEMLAIAREEVPEGRFEPRSLWEAELPPCAAVTAIGEALGYRPGPEAPDLDALTGRFEAIRRALAAGAGDQGLFLLDLAGPGRSGPTGRRQVTWSRPEAFLALEETEATETPRLTRRLETFLRDPGNPDLYHRSAETHHLVLYRPEEVETALRTAGFSAERLSGYGDFPFPNGWTGFVATPE